MAPIGGYGTTLIVAGADQALRHPRAEGPDPRQHRQGIRRGDRDDRARGRARTSATSRRRRSARTAASSSTGRRSSSRTPTSPTTSWSSAAPRRASQARGPLDDLRPQGHRGNGDDADRHDGRPRHQHRLSSTTARSRAEQLLGEVDRGWMQLMAGLNVERLILAGDHARHRAARLRRRPRLREGAKAVRPPDRLLPGAPAPLRRPRHRPRGGSPDDPLGREPHRRGPRQRPAQGVLDGQALRHRDRSEGRARRACR